MNKKMVLIVDEDDSRVEKLVFMARLGGYMTRVFANETAALNWAKYGCVEGEVLCLLFNTRVERVRAEQLYSLWTAAGMTLPVVLVQRGKGGWNRTLDIGEMDHFVVCEPESVMQTLEILTEITAHDRFDADKCVEIKTMEMGGVVKC